MKLTVEVSSRHIDHAMLYRQQCFHRGQTNPLALALLERYPNSVVWAGFDLASVADLECMPHRRVWVYRHNYGRVADWGQGVFDLELLVH